MNLNVESPLTLGVVPARSSLRCEFVCLPTHDSPNTALFRLVVVGEEGEGSGGDGVPGEGVTSGGVASGTGRGVQKDTFLTLRAEVHAMYMCKQLTSLYV